MLSRRQVMRSAAIALAAPMMPRVAFGASFPERPVRVIITAAAGGVSDVVARLTSNPVSERLGQPFIVENRSGGGGVAAALATKSAPADGYTVLAVSRAQIIYNLFYDTQEVDFTRDFVPVVSLAAGALQLLINPKVPAKTLPEFIAYAKANPGKLSYGSAGKGSDPHLTAELFKMATGTDLVHVPYRGGAPALTDLLSGNIDMFFSTLPVGEYLASGRLRILGVTTPTRRSESPEVPAIAEFVPGFEVDVWHGLVARRDSPPDTVKLLYDAYTSALTEPKTVAGLAPLSFTPAPMTREALPKYFEVEIDKWGKVIKAQNIKLD